MRLPLVGTVHPAITIELCKFVLDNQWPSHGRDGTTALDLIRAHNESIDVLLLDVTLPGASSREVLEEARRLKPGLSVIVTSANSEEMANATLACKVERFIRKPFGLDDLIGLVRLSMFS